MFGLGGDDHRWTGTIKLPTPPENWKRRLAPSIQDDGNLAPAAGAQVGVPPSHRLPSPATDEEEELLILTMLDLV